MVNTSATENNYDQPIPSHLTPPSSFLEKQIKLGIEEKVDELMLETIEAAKAELERKVRAATAQISATILSKFSFMRDGQDLVIRVEFFDKQK